jgi:HJR/Mrr/RecB family endonuclease
LAVVINYAKEQPAQVALVVGLLVLIAHRRVRPSTSKDSSADVFEGGIPSDIEDLLVLSPSEFEVYVRDLLSMLNYRDLKVCGGAGDLGVDILGRDPDGKTVAIQCKRYDPGRSVGSPAIQSFMGMQQRQHLTDVGIFVTTSGFTRPARSLAQDHGILLIDGVDLLELQRQALQPNPSQPDLAHKVGKRSASFVSRLWDAVRRT